MTSSFSLFLLLICLLETCFTHSFSSFLTTSLYQNKAQQKGRHNNDGAGLQDASWNRALQSSDLESLEDFINRIPEEERGSMTELVLDENTFSGAIPSLLGTLTSLTALVVSNNLFTSTLPSEFENLSELEILNLSSNCLTGDFLTRIEDFPNLAEIDIGSNKFSGDASGLLDLSSLETFIATGNDLSGSIPEDIGVLANLTVLDLANNRLTGTVPEELGDLNLTILLIENNLLEGIMPETTATMVDVEPGSELVPPSLETKLANWNLPEQCPNRGLFLFGKVFDLFLVPVAIGLSVFLLLLLLCCFFCIRCYRRRRRNKREEEDDNSSAIHCFMSHSLNATHEHFNKMEMLTALMLVNGIIPLMISEEETTELKNSPSEMEAAELKKINQSQAFVILLTRDYLAEMLAPNSRCTREFKTALESGIKKLIFVCLEKNIYSHAQGMQLFPAAYMIMDMQDNQLMISQVDALVAEINAMNEVFMGDDTMGISKIDSL